MPINRIKFVETPDARRGGLDACFDLVSSHFPPALVSAAAQSKLRAGLANLVPLSPFRVGFECRLAAGAGQVDLQQGIAATGAARLGLREHVAGIVARGHSTVHPAWRRVETFCAWWCDPASPAHRDVVDLWLEFDLDSNDAAAAAPSVFLGLPQKPGATAQTFETAVAAVGLLEGAPVAGRRLQTLRRCFEVCENGAYVSHLGTMLARDTPWLRVNLKQVPGGEIPSLLEQLDWPGDGNQLRELLPRLAAFSDGITTCLDVTEELSPRVGLECAVEQEVGGESRWRALLDRLVADGLCAPEKANALLAWPGYVDPMQAPAGWPVALMGQSLRQPSDHFSAIRREVSHLKVTCQPSRPPEAKGYFGFTHVWLKPATAEANVVRSAAVTQRSFSRGALSESVEQAIGFLLDARSSTGWWTDYDQWDEGGASTEWVTAYVGSALAEFSRSDCRRAASWAWALLKSSRDDHAGWGWAQHAPADADSTAWGLRLAQGVGTNDGERIVRAREFLALHCFPEGVHTYREEYYWRFTGHAVLPPELRSYFEPHTCVTAAVASLPGQRALLPCLRALQQSDGRWLSHWWPDDDYATAFAAEALAVGGESGDLVRIERAVNWCRGRLSADGCVRTTSRPNGSAFSTSLALRTLLLTPEISPVQDAVGAAARWLLNHQDVDGSWGPSADMYVRRAEHPLVDSRAVLTTATVLTALRGLQETLHNGAGCRI